jgi:hypothetical protein
VDETACGGSTGPITCEFCSSEKHLRYLDDSSIRGILGCIVLFETHSLLHSHLFRKTNSSRRFELLVAILSTCVMSQWITCPVARERVFAVPAKLVSRERYVPSVRWSLLPS